MESLFGNDSAQRALLHIYHYGEIHASAIAKDYNIAVTPIKNQLERLERVGVVVSKEVGKTRVFFLNDKSPFKEPLKEILKIQYETIPIEDREKIFGSRRRPRRTGKPIR